MTARIYRPLLAVLAGALALAACAAPSSDSGNAAAASAAKIAQLRVGAALPPCPSGLGPALPDLTLSCLSGGPKVALRAPSTGKPRLVNIWATWCGPCVREVPALIAVAKAARGQLEVVGVLTEDDEVNGLEFARQFGMPYTSVLDTDGRVLRAFSPGPPATLFLAPDGTVKFVQRGEIKSAKALRDLIRTHLGIAVADSAGS